MRTPQLNDDVVLTLVLPAETEEWADEELSKDFDVERDPEYRLVVTQRVGGNCNALVVARGFLDEVEEILFELNVDPMSFELRAVAMEPGLSSPTA